MTRPFPATWALWGFALLLFMAGETLAIVNRLEGARGWNDFLWLFFSLTFSLATLGALILARHPGHAIGWLLYAVGVFFELSFFATEYGLFALVTRPDSLPLGREVAALTWIGGTAFFLMTSLLFLLFPNGRTLSPRWNIFILLGIAGTTLASLSEWLRPGPLDEPLEAWTNPLGVEALADITEPALTAGFVLIAICGVAGAGSLVLRFRRADGIEREQLKWVASSAVVFISCWLFQLLLEPLGGSDALQQVFVSVGVATIPVAAGLAILRYRLYDIDWIINRTLVYVPLTAVLAGVYIALTGVFRELLTQGTGGNSDFAIAMATVIVVSMLTPVKNYLQALVDRHFKDSQDPARALHKLAADTRSAVEVLDSEGYVKRFLSETVSILEASGATLRIHDGARVLSQGEVSDEPAVVLPLQRDGRELGVLEVGERNNGRPYTDGEMEALRESSDVIAYLVSLQPSMQALQER
jgi:hypothetical protein